MKTVEQHYNEVSDKLSNGEISSIGIDFNLQDLRQMIKKGKSLTVLGSHCITNKAGDESKVSVLLMNDQTVIQVWANKSLFQIGVKVMALDSPFKISEITDSGREFEGNKIWDVKGDYID